jgi:MerR family copper efflux transcriptional regulator
VLLDLWSDRDRASAEVKTLAESRAADLGRKADALNAMREALLELAKACHGNERPECPIITRLAS